MFKGVMDLITLFPVMEVIWSEPWDLEDPKLTSTITEDLI